MGSFCSLPWIHLATHPHGGLTLCCQSEMVDGLSAAANGHDVAPLSLNTHSISELVNSKSFREVRLAFLRGERHPACGPCWLREDQGTLSKRQYDSARFPLSIDEARERTAEDGSISPDIQFAELRLGNVCNIKCVTCNPNSSAQLVREHSQLQKMGDLAFLRDYSWVVPGMSAWTEDETFWLDLTGNSRSLREVYINGGEPMLIGRHQGFLERLVRSGQARDVRLTYSINMTKLLEPLRSVWREFREVHFACSVDAWDTKNFYLRYPSPWDSVTSNFGKLREWGFHPHVLQTVSALNFYSLDEFYARWQSVFPESVVALNEVIDPPWFSPLVLAPDWRREILRRLGKTLPPHLMQQLRRMYDNDTYSLAHWEQLRLHLRGFDELRDLDVRNYFPELEAFLRDRGTSLRP